MAMAGQVDPLATALERIAELEAELDAARRSIADLTTALESNREIGAAIGIVMATREVTSESAFDLLRAASQARHLKLRDVAREVISQGRLDPAPPTKPRRAVPTPPPAERESAAG
jgi:AmiR/NasT family two-component response regulator